MTLLIAGGVADTALSQNQPRHNTLHANMPPGIAAQRRLMADGSLAQHTQSVRVVGPDGTRLSIVVGEGFMETNESAQTVGMRVGPVYRFKITGIAQNQDRELYPSIELLDRLYPPEGLENKFPVPVVISTSDLKEALGGAMVTKIIYLEDAETALPRDLPETGQPFFDVSAAEDPLKTAAGLGRPLAILRIGSRVPTSGELSSVELTAFHSDSPELLPQPVEQPDHPGLFSLEPVVGSNQPE